MGIKDFLRRYTLVLIALIFVLLLYLIPYVISGRLIESIDKYLLVSGWLLFLLRYLYDKWEGLYININRIALWLFNKKTQWNFDVLFSVNEYSYSSDKLWNIIKEFNESADRWHSDSRNLIVNMPGYTLRIFLGKYRSGEDYTEGLSIQVSNLILPYRTLKNKIENEIIPLISKLSNTIRPDNEKYAVKIKFTSPNPYFGYFVRKLEMPKVVSFSCDFIEDSIADRDQIVTVRKDSIDIVTDNLHAARSLSLKYTAFDIN